MQIVECVKWWKDAPSDWPVYSKSFRQWSSEAFKKIYASPPEYASPPVTDKIFALRLKATYFFYNLNTTTMCVFPLETAQMSMEEKITVYNNIIEAKIFSEIDALYPVAKPKVEIWAWKVDKKGVSHECV